MSREILFKAKRTDNGEWVEGSLFLEGSRSEIIRGTCNGVGIEGVAVEKSTICQYTGLTDKNGKKIWEHDIVKETYLKYTVLWDEDEGAFMRKSPHDVMYGIGKMNCKNFEVIGNIFDNPELLKEGAE